MLMAINSVRLIVSDNAAIERDNPPPLHHTHMMDDSDDHNPALLPPYLPLHQQEAIHAFLDRVLEIGDDLHECTVCLERYHGMKLRDMACTRCHKEVLTSLFLA